MCHVAYREGSKILLVGLLLLHPNYSLEKIFLLQHVSLLTIILFVKICQHLSKEKTAVFATSNLGLTQLYYLLVYKRSYI